jgi:hypothetical protein
MPKTHPTNEVQTHVFGGRLYTATDHERKTYATPAQAASLIGVSRRTITLWFDRGILTPVQWGRYQLIERVKVRELAKQYRGKPRARSSR